MESHHDHGNAVVNITSVSTVYLWSTVLNVSNNDTNQTLGDQEREDKQSFYNAVYVLYMYAIPLISITGIIGNTLSFRVFTFTSFGNHPSCIYLASLSISDTSFLFALLIGWIGSLDDLNIYNDTFCIVSIYIAYVTSFLSAWYVVLIMIDRYIVVCHPLRGPKLCSKRRVIIATMIVTIVAVLFYTHCFFTTKIDNSKNNEISVCVFQEDDIKFLAVITYIDSSVTFIVPFISVCVLSFCVIISIRRFHFRLFRFHEQKYYSPKFNILSKAQVRLTVMLVVVSCVFLVLNLPSHGFKFFILVNNLSRNHNNGLILFLIQQCLQFLYYSNFSVNFLLYFISSKSFRKCIKEPCRR